MTLSESAPINRASRAGKARFTDCPDQYRVNVRASSGEKYFSKMRCTVPSARMSSTSARQAFCCAGDSDFFDMISPCSTAGSSNSTIVVCARGWSQS